MTDKEKKELLKKVWNNCTFDEIIDEGFILNKCGAINLLDAAEQFRETKLIDPLTDEELLDEMVYKGLNETMTILQDKFSIKEIINDGLGLRDVLDEIDPDEMLDSLEHTWELNRHDDEVRSNYYAEMYDDIIKEIKIKEIEKINEVENYSPDELHNFICDIFRIGYYDQKGLKEGIEKCKEKLNKNTYNINYG